MGKPRVAFRIHPEHIAKAEALLPRLAAKAVVWTEVHGELTLSDVYRVALGRGLDLLEKELKGSRRGK